MNGKGEEERAEHLRFDAAGAPGDAEVARGPGGRPGPTWRAWLISIVAAVALSAAATLLLGGWYHVPAAGVPGGCGAAGNCCPPADPGK